MHKPDRSASSHQGGPYFGIAVARLCDVAITGNLGLNHVYPSDRSVPSAVPSRHDVVFPVSQLPAGVGGLSDSPGLMMLKLPGSATNRTPPLSVSGSPALFPLCPLRATSTTLLSLSCELPHPIFHHSLRVLVYKMDINTLTPYVADALCVLALHYGSHIALRVNDMIGLSDSWRR